MFLEFLGRRSISEGIPLPVENPSLLRSWIHGQKVSALKEDGGRNAVGQGKNWSVFDFCNQFLQSKEGLMEAVKDLLGRLSKWGVVYVEIRFCPDLHTDKGLTPEQVVEAVIQGIVRVLYCQLEQFS